MKESNMPFSIQSISQQHQLLRLPRPHHPLVSVFNFADIKTNTAELADKFTLGFYCVAIKKGFKGKMKYGQHYYDFDEGIMSFIAPGQLLSVLEDDDNPCGGCCLMFHPDLMVNYPLAKEIKKYGFFSYELNEALHLSEPEEVMVETLMKNIDEETRSRIDLFSQDVIISQIELLLNYSNRFYNRQFITRKNAGNDLLINLENILANYFDDNNKNENGLPTVQYVAEQLHVSAHYLSDMLRTLTGQTTQQHIHNSLIEKAKEILSTTSLSVSEIAYRLGFEYPQSFNKLFKNKMNTSPLEFRQSFN